MITDMSFSFLKHLHKVRIRSVAVLLLIAAFSVAFYGQYRLLKRITLSYETIPLCNDNRCQSVFKTGPGMQHFSFLDDTTLLCVSGSSLFLMSAGDTIPSLEFKGHDGYISDYEIDPENDKVVTSSEDGTLRLWEARTGRCLAVSCRLDTLDQPCWTMLQDVVFHPGGKRLMTADMEGVKVWRTSDLKLVSRVDTDLFYMSKGLLSPDWKTVCCPECPGGRFQVCRLVDERPLQSLSDDSPLCYSPDGKWLLMASLEDGSMTMMDVNPRTASGKTSFIIFPGPDEAVISAAFSADGSQLASAHSDGTVRIWNSRTGSQREVLHWEGRHIDSVCFSRDGVEVLACDSRKGEYCIWGPFSWLI